VHARSALGVAVAVVRGAGHLLVEEEPDVVADVIVDLLSARRAPSS